MKQSPWGKIITTKRINKNVFIFETNKHGGIAVKKEYLLSTSQNPDLITTLCGIEQDDYVYFEKNYASCLLLVDNPKIRDDYLKKIDSPLSYDTIFNIAKSTFSLYFFKQ